MRPGEALSLTVTLPNEQRNEIPEAVVRWSRGEEFAVEHMAMEPRIHVGFNNWPAFVKAHGV